MRISTFTDYCLRALIYLAIQPGGLATRSQIAAAYQISDNHLMKVVHCLGKAGLIDTVRGRSGGLRLAPASLSMRVGDLVKLFEGDTLLVECFADGSDCRIDGVCALKHALKEAQQAMFDVLNRYTLADLTSKQDAIAQRLGLIPVIETP